MRLPARKQGESEKKGEMNMINVITSTSTIADFYVTSPPGEDDGIPSGLLSETHDQSCTEHLTSYIRTYFKFAYYICLSPFRFQRDGNGNFHVKKWLPQQVTCAFMSILSMIRLLTEIRLSTETRSKKTKATPVEYFTNVMTLFSFAYKTTTLKRFWRNQNEYLKILTVSKNCFHRYCGSSSSSKESLVSWIVNPYMVHGIIAIITLQPLIDFIAGKNLMSDRYWHWSADLWASRIIELARYSFFLERNELHHDPNNATTVKVSAFDGFLGFVMALSLLQRFALGFYCDLCIFSCAITTWIHANNFARRVKTIQMKNDLQSQSKSKIGSSLQWNSVYKHFQACQKLSKAVNEAIGSQMTLSLAESVIYYSLNLNAVMTVGNPFKRMDFIYFYLLNGITFIVAADIGSQMESVKDLIKSGWNRHKIPQEEMNIVLHEMIAKDIGIRGSNAFTITYPFLAAVLSTTVTIFIISIQSSERRGGGGTDDSYLIFSKRRRHNQ